MLWATWPNKYGTCKYVRRKQSIGLIHENFIWDFPFHFVLLTLFFVDLTNSCSKITNKYQLKQKI